MFLAPALRKLITSKTHEEGGGYWSWATLDLIFEYIARRGPLVDGPVWVEAPVDSGNIHAHVGA